VEVSAIHDKAELSLGLGVIVFATTADELIAEKASAMASAMESAVSSETRLILDEFGDLPACQERYLHESGRKKGRDDLYRYENSERRLAKLIVEKPSAMASAVSAETHLILDELGDLPVCQERYSYESGRKKGRDDLCRYSEKMLASLLMRTRESLVQW
jgi:hypothetical protein